jgi:hypothetical protein
MAGKQEKLGLMPTLVVLVMVLGLAFLIGVILLMMLARTGIRHSPAQTRVEHALPGFSTTKMISSGLSGDESA